MYEAISGYFVVLDRNCLASTLDYIVMQMRKINRKKGYCMQWAISELPLALFFKASLSAHPFLCKSMSLIWV